MVAWKRIILLLDGTWNDPEVGTAHTNIVRLREIIAGSLDQSSPLVRPPSSEEGFPQTTATRRTFTYQKIPREYLVFYERGVGTGAFFDNFRGGAFGAGLARNIRRAYKFLSSFYEEGDEVFVFGFSRGSYTARSLAGYLGSAGLLKKEFCTPALESKAWYFYRTAPQDRMPSTAGELAHFVHDRGQFRIHCLGVFDTVGALGIPLRALWRENRELYEFHDVDLSSVTNVNLHALAIDEHREAFEAAIWRTSKFRQLATFTEQVWFAGAHSDVGGGYVPEEDRRKDTEGALDDISLDWMLKRVLVYFPDFPFHADHLPNWRKIPSSAAFAAQHEPRKNFYRLSRFALRSIANCAVPLRGFFERNVCRDIHAQPINESIHVSVLQRLGQMVSMDWSKGVYAPRNVLAVIGNIEATYGLGPRKGSEIRVIDWSGKPLDPNVKTERDHAAETIQSALHRLGRRIPADGSPSARGVTAFQRTDPS